MKLSRLYQLKLLQWNLICYGLHTGGQYQWVQWNVSFAIFFFWKMKPYLENISLISPVLKCLPNTDITRRFFYLFIFLYLNEKNLKINLVWLFSSWRNK